VILLAIGLTILFNLDKNNSFQVKSLTFGLKRSDKKAKSFELLAKASVKMLEV
jgi:hypothetical protein